jgi:hypothetical protein
MSVGGIRAEPVTSDRNADLEASGGSIGVPYMKEDYA